ncbi:hypothetical protein E2C01_053503 [Portunus trituberculatus]|uniref:Uncharacterized protein n=1 Tax=Portunus trituberculatus TaxID=210409 RepID=A0A5B7GPJ3_PORTR|nr:hypothetical protein [Portunus trituberculatus]
MKDVGTRDFTSGGSESYRSMNIFLWILNAEFIDIPLHSNVKGLSAGKTQHHFFAVQKDILL